jgi:hypothetical protein
LASPLPVGARPRPREQETACVACGAGCALM